MAPASRLFYLSLFALWAAPGSCASPASSECPISSKAIVDDACASYGTLERLNAVVRPAVTELTQKTDYFSHYRLNLFNKVCPFWDDENGICGNIGCAVETLDNEDDVPEVWRASELSKLEGPRARHPAPQEQRRHPERPLQGELGEGVGESCVFEFDDECDERDYCVPEDESAASKGDYVSLSRNPERFTGYGGEGAWQVWDAIYRENCFSRSSFPRYADLGPPSSGLGLSDVQHVLRGPGAATTDADDLDGECLEKRVFYRIISGMHASISTHLCWDFLNQTTGEWQPNLACYTSRLHEHPDRISNLYFNYALVTRAVAKLGPYLRNPGYTFCSGDPSEDAATRAKCLEVIQRAASVPQIFDESLMFVNGEGPSLKEDFRNRFRNVSRLMDCVGCDKCRLWGKVQTAGYGAALKVLFEFDNHADGPPPALKRTEIVALFNTYARLADSLGTIGSFRSMVEEGEGAGETAELPSDAASQGFGLEYETVEEEESVDAGDEEMKEFIRMRNRGPKSRSMSDVFDHEFSRFLLAIKIVVHSWIRTPRALYNIATTELVRLWQFWLGLPVNRRWWKFRLPDLDRDDL